MTEYESATGRRIRGSCVALLFGLASVCGAQETPVPTVPAERPVAAPKDSLERAMSDIEHSLRLHERVAIQLKELSPEKVQELAVSGLAELVQKTEALLNDAKKSLETSLESQEAMNKAAAEAESQVATEVVVIKSANVADVANALQALTGAGMRPRPDRPGPSASGTTIVPNETLNSVLLSGPPDEVQRLMEVAGKLDKAPDPVPNLELLIYVVKGASEGGEGQPAPEQLTASIDKLRTLFPYTNYSLVDTMLLRARGDGSASSTSSVAFTGGTLRQEVQVDRVSVDKGASDINLSKLIYQATYEEPPKPAEPATVDPQAPVRPVPVRRTGPSQPQTSLTADLDLASGEQAIAGKASFGADESALFLIVTARVVEPNAP